MSYQPRIDEHGHECCTRITSDGMKAYGLRTASGTLATCAACQAHHEAMWRANSTRQEDDMTTALEAPPDPYADGLSRLKAASATPFSAFEDEWKADRLRDLTVEHARFAAAIAARPTPRLTVAEESKYAAPDSYKLALDKMRSGR